MKKAYGILLISGGFLFGSCANMYVKQGNKKFDAEAYSQAAALYKKALDKKQIVEAQVKLAHTYRLLNNPLEAEKLYREVVALPESEPVNQFYFGQVLMQNRKYEEAAAAFKEYAKTVPDDKVVQNMIYAAENWRTFDNGMDTCAYALKKIEVSGYPTAYGGAPFNFGYVFSAPAPAGSKKGTDKYTGGGYLDLFFIKKDKSTGKWSSPEALKGGVNSEYHDAFATFSADGQTIYFTRSNLVNGKVKKNKKNVVTLKILKATFLEGEWTNVEEFPYNSDEFSNAHPSLSRDGKTLYFSSDRPGGYGGWDLYASTWDGSKWGEPVNLGPTINTSAREVFPMIGFNEKLYFSSEGHPGLGGLDVFVSTRNGSSWSKPENLKTPVNSSYDDFSFTLDDEGKLGNVSSTRFGGTDLVGNDQMYELTYKDPILQVDVCVKKKDGKQPAAGVSVQASNLSTGEKVSATTNSNGVASFRLPAEARFSFSAGSEAWVSTSVEVNTAGKTCSDIVTVCSTDTIFVEPVIVDPNAGVEYSVGPIYYDFNKWDIRPDAMPNLDKLVSLLNANPNLTVEMGSHTDCRGSDAYNQRLSENRAKSVVKYCTNRDISAKRLKYKGYGESDPIEKCVCEECSEDQHQKNRRTSFRIIDTKKK